MRKKNAAESFSTRCSTEVRQRRNLLALSRESIVTARFGRGGSFGYGLRLVVRPTDTVTFLPLNEASDSSKPKPHESQSEYRAMQVVKRQNDMNRDRYRTC